MAKNTMERILDLLLMGKHEEARQLGLKYTKEKERRKALVTRETDILVNRIQRYLRETGCTRTNFAKKVGTSSQFLSLLLKHERNADAELHREIDLFLSEWGY